MPQTVNLFGGPAEGSQACGEVGAGRMLEPQEILANIRNFFTSTCHLETSGELQGQSVVITAGPTRSKRSTRCDTCRIMSQWHRWALRWRTAAAAGRSKGSPCIAGPVNLPTPEGVQRIDVAKRVRGEQMLACKVLLGGGGGPQLGAPRSAE